MRVDKWLWTVRVFKTRNLATAACRGNLVTIEGKPVKPSREIQIGETIEIEKDIAVRKMRVLDTPERRISAKEADRFREDLTPEKPRARFSFLDDPAPRRERGTGRPTKRERRLLDNLLGRD